ncbi:RnfH family protein [Candidatus Erwinia haradaeae]|uniref:UPF0125 protein ERCICUMA2628_574 n=1 Tax=Candidatus Erwinia haradaeae TaxID=1922217 RepID=A0A451D3C9_9GAMM|nr:RnfH family protein [Candidatus Erwinia haradaeae]VFP80167.1 UPF0125 protein RatB [Candidatus Erwinia haradaeae]
MSNIFINLVYALPKKQYIYHIELASGSNVGQAIIISDILFLRPEINLKKNKIGIFGRFVKLSEILYDGDRIEIYRPMTAKPKDLFKRR